MKNRSILISTVTLAAILTIGGCASKPKQQYRLECRGAAASQFEECGKVFDSATECQAAQQRMVRTPGLRARDRGTCLKGHNR